MVNIVSFMLYVVDKYARDLYMLIFIAGWSLSALKHNYSIAGKVGKVAG